MQENETKGRPVSPLPSMSTSQDKTFSRDTTVCVKDTWNNSHQSYHNSNCNVFVGCHISFDSSNCVQIPFTDNRMSTDKINTPSPTTRDIQNQNCSHQHFGNQIDIPVTSPPREIPSSREQATPKENVLPSNISKCSKERWDTLQKYKYALNGREYLHSSWTDTIAGMFDEIKGLFCCIRFNQHYVPKSEASDYLFLCTFGCSITGCKGKAVLDKEYILNVQLLNKPTAHGKGQRGSFKARHIREPKRKDLGKQLHVKESTSKAWHKHLSSLDNDDFLNGNLRSMGNSKHVYKTIKSEAAKSARQDKDLVVSVLKLKKYYQSVVGKTVKGFIQSFSLDPLAICLWTEDEIEIYHKRAKHFPLLVDATCGIIFAVNDKRVFYFAIIIHNGKVKTEPIPVFQFMTNQMNSPSRQH